MKKNSIILIYSMIAAVIFLTGCAVSSTDDEASNTAPEEIVAPDTAYYAGVSVKPLWPDQKDIDDRLINMAAYGILGIRCSSCSPVLKANATGVHDVPYVRSFTIRQGSEVFAFAVLDAPLIGNRYTRTIEKRCIGCSWDTKGSCIYICYTHPFRPRPFWLHGRSL